MSDRRRYYDLQQSGALVWCVAWDRLTREETALHHHRYWDEAVACTRRPQRPIGSQPGGTIPDHLHGTYDPEDIAKDLQREKEMFTADRETLQDDDEREDRMREEMERARLDPDAQWEAEREQEGDGWR